MPSVPTPSDRSLAARFHPDDARAFQVDVERGAAPVKISCAFSGPGSAQRVLIYADAPVYKVLGMPVDIAWVLVAECPASANGSLPRSGSALVTSPAVARTLLITAWDSTARGTWAQMERYSAKRLGDTMMLHFTRGPSHPSIDAAIVDAVVPRKTP